MKRTIVFLLIVGLFFFTNPLCAIVDDEQVFSDIKGAIVPVLSVLTCCAALIGGYRVGFAFMNDDQNAKTMLRRYIYTIGLMSVLTAFCVAIKRWAQ